MMRTARDNQHRRIAQRQSASIHTEEVAAFNSCSAYQSSRPRILFLSHCVPNPPDKGEKIRAFHLLRVLARRYEVHLVCLARTAAEKRDAAALEECCASVHAEVLRRPAAFRRGLLRIAAGGSFNAGYFSSPGLTERVGQLAALRPFDAVLVYTAVMAPYAPEGVPVVLDLVDVDSEKWFQYGRERRPGPLYRIEASRLRRFETHCATASALTVLATANELAIFRGFAPEPRAIYVENGVESSYFEAAPAVLDTLRKRRFIAFVGTMNYRPNIDAVRWFAAEVFPAVRRTIPDLEFLVVGRNPAKAVRELAEIDGIEITGAVPDVRPYLSSARAIVAPLRLARGIQNKVLEALAMGRPVLASPEVCTTFGSRVPTGVLRCDSAAEYASGIEAACDREPRSDPAIRAAVRDRFDWEKNVAAITDALDSIVHSRTAEAPD